MKQKPLKKLASLIWLVLVWVNLNSLKAISFKGRFPGCMSNPFYIRWLDILEIIFWFSFNVMYLDENNGNLSETKNAIYSQPFLKMRKFLFDMRKGFLTMSNFYLVDILSEPNSLTIVTSKKTLKMINYVLILSFFSSQNKNQEFAV